MASLRCGAGRVQHEVGRHDADQHQHEQADALLAVIGAVHEAHAHGRQHQHQAVPERRVLLVVDRAALIRRLVHLGQRQPALEQQQQSSRDQESGNRRGHQRQADIDGLAPVDAIGQRQVGDQRIGQAHTQDRADQGVRAGGGDAEIPGAQVPGDGGGQHGEHHGQPAARIHVDQQFHRQQVDDGVGHAHTAQQHAQEVEDARQHHRQMRRHGLGVDDRGHGVCRPAQD
ncbi:hypothetical protein G6F57_018967 [Rhizopus arrhizus]|nr:hypothetical protein G6F57_018967 [Rhizopus arrhizus]